MANHTSGKQAAAAAKRRVPVYLHALWVIVALGLLFVGARVWNLEKQVQQGTVAGETIAAGDVATTGADEPAVAVVAAAATEGTTARIDEHENETSTTVHTAEPATNRSTDIVVTALAAPPIGQGITATALPAADADRTLTAPPVKERYYWTRPGDSLWTISRRVYGAGRHYTHIAEANGLDDPTLIQAHVLLLIPELR